MNDIDVKRRVLSKPKEMEQFYDYYPEVVHDRLEATRNNLIELEVYYSTKYNNLKTIDGNLSKWGIF